MIYNKKEFFTGSSLLVVFAVVLVFMFQPIYHGHNGMEFLDHLYNAISKGSVEYSEMLEPQAQTFMDHEVQLELSFDTVAEAEQSVKLFTAAGASSSNQGRVLTMSGSLGSVLMACIHDAEAMYHNNDQELSAKYGIEGRRALFNWWTSLKLMDRALKKQKDFAGAKIANTIQTKSVEAAYNYFGIEPVHIMDRLGMVIFSLVFYVLYTLWYGFAIMFVFEGWGLKLSH